MGVAFDFVIEPIEKRGDPEAESSDVQWVPMERCYHSIWRSITPILI